MAAEPESFRVDGDGDYVEHRRQKAILDAKEIARDVIVEAERLHARGEISAEVMQADAKAVVDSYITEVEHIARSVGATERLQDQKIHTVEISPPEELLKYFDDPNTRVLSERPKPKRATTIRGLWGYLTAPDVFSAEWTIKVDTRHEGPKSITATGTTRMPLEASKDARRHVDAFLERVGLDLEPRYNDYTGDEGPGL